MHIQELLANHVSLYAYQKENKMQKERQSYIPEMMLGSGRSGGNREKSRYQLLMGREEDREAATL